MRSVAIHVVAVLAAFASGCGADEACLQWGEADGACPSPEQALDYLDPPCEEPIESVDSEGEFDGQSCCYAITKAEEDTCESKQ